MKSRIGSKLPFGLQKAAHCLRFLLKSRRQNRTRFLSRARVGWRHRAGLQGFGLMGRDGLGCWTRRKLSRTLCSPQCSAEGAKAKHWKGALAAAEELARPTRDGQRGLRAGRRLMSPEDPGDSRNLSPSRRDR